MQTTESGRNRGVGGRTMPSWFNEGPNSMMRVPPPPPSSSEDSLPTILPQSDGHRKPKDPDYEEIDHFRPRLYSNANGNATGNQNSSCSLCGNSLPVVRCEMCNDQIFCGPCNDMFHRHPKRHSHIRTLLQLPPPSNAPAPELPSFIGRPPLPPKQTFQHQLQVTAHSPEIQDSWTKFSDGTPIPPPRRKPGRFVAHQVNMFGSLRPATSTPQLHFIKQKTWDPVGTLKRFVGGLTNPGLPPIHQTTRRNTLLVTPPPSPGLNRRCSTPTGTGINSGRNNVRSDSHWNGPNGKCQTSPIPTVVLDMSQNPQSSRGLFGSATQLGSITPTATRSSNEENAFRTQQPVAPDSFSGHREITSRDRFSTDNSMHFGTLGRARRDSNSSMSSTTSSHFQNPPRPPPPLPPKDFPSMNPHLKSRGSSGMFQSSSVYDLRYPREDIHKPQATFAPINHNSFQSQWSNQPSQAESRMSWDHSPLHRPPSTSSLSGIPSWEERFYGNQEALKPPPLPKKPQKPPSVYQQQEQQTRASSVVPSYRPDSRMSLQSHRESDEEVLNAGLSDDGELSDGGLSSISIFEGATGAQMTPEPTGPWRCEHCTFINPKSNKICTICCKTPSKGYLPAKGSKKISTSGFRGEGPIIKSKLSFSAAPGGSVNLQEEYENSRINKPRKKGDSNEDVYGMSISQIGSLSISPGKTETRGRQPGFATQTLVANQSRLQTNKETPTKQKGISRDSGAGSYSTSSSSNSSAVHLPDKREGIEPIDLKTSKGTSPPPQTISTQTYDVLPPPNAPKKGKRSPIPERRRSLGSSSSEGEEGGSSPSPRPTMAKSSPPGRSKILPEDLDLKPVEMSEKALRYARRAQQHSKMKRSLSMHLNEGPFEPFDQPMYRSSSRHSLAYDTRGFPSSREPSPPPDPRFNRMAYPAGNFGGFPPLNSQFNPNPNYPSIPPYFYPPPQQNPPTQQPFQMQSQNWDSFPTTNPADYFASMEDLAFRRRNSVRTSEFELSRLLKEAEEFNYTPEDVQVSLRMCGDRHPIKWLQDNWPNMIETVQTLATKSGREKGPENNDIGTISTQEAKEALRANKGNVWAAVAECSTQRRKKFLELQSRGAFIREDILTALTANHGNLEAAYIELSKSQLKPFLMRIWGPPSGQENEAIPTPSMSSAASVKGSLDLKLDLQDFPPGFLYSHKPGRDSDPSEPGRSLFESGNEPEDEEDEEEELRNPDDEVEGDSDFIFIDEETGNEMELETEGESNIDLEGEIDSNSLMNLLKQKSLKKEQSLIDNFLKMGALWDSISSVRKSRMDHKRSSRAQSVASAPPTSKKKYKELKAGIKSDLASSKMSLQAPPVGNAKRLVVHRGQTSVERARLLEKAEKMADSPAVTLARARVVVTPPNEELSIAHEEVVQGKLVLPGRSPLQNEAVSNGETSNSVKTFAEKSRELYESLSNSSLLPSTSYEGSKSNEIEDGPYSDTEQDSIVDDDEEEEYETYSEDDEAYEEIDFAVQRRPSPIKEFHTVKPESLKVLKKEEPVTKKPLSPFQMKVKGLVESGKIGTDSGAEMALQLMDMNFGEEDSLAAAQECSSMYSALSFLQQECNLCAGKFSAKQTISMIQCTHSCCSNCARNYFSVQLRDHSILDLTCPFCKEPSYLADETDQAAEYFNHLDIMLKNILDEAGHEMFQRKLRDWALAKTPNFKWCSKCSSGFITEPLQTRLICPDCKSVTCAICLAPWDRNHNHRDDPKGLSLMCDQGDASRSVVDFLNENSIECPQCKFKYALARGGCMHLTCTHCKHEFCSGCSAPFKMGKKCALGAPLCEKLGLHAHHPRNCLFYLRDKEPGELSMLLEDNGIPYLKETIDEPPTGETQSILKRRCQVPIQKELEDGELKDDICGEDAPRGYANICLSHYIEYLGLLIWQNRIDPVPILNNDDLEVIIRRTAVKFPGKPAGIAYEDQRLRLLKIIHEQIPL